MTPDLAPLIDAFAGVRVLVLGEAMLDSYLEGSTGRFCQEAPAPVVALSGRKDVPGGAANAAVNVQALGGEAMFLSVIGDDLEGSLLSQKGAGRDQLATRHSPLATIPDLGGRLETFRDTAAVMQCLDLVITCDSAVAHLAGALGVQIWVALAWLTDWRWLLKREDTPWYPTMRLFRQKERGNWEQVFERITREVQKIATPCHATEPSNGRNGSVTTISVCRRQMLEPVDHLLEGGRS
jgi:hypothetical protein